MQKLNQSQNLCRKCYQKYSKYLTVYSTNMPNWNICHIFEKQRVFLRDPEYLNPNHEFSQETWKLKAETTHFRETSGSSKTKPHIIHILLSHGQTQK